MVQLIYDYVENVTRKQIKKIIHLEDFIESSPSNPDKTDCVYQLFDVEYDTGDSSKYVLVTSSSANMVLPGNEAVLMDLFPDYLPKDNASKDSNQISPQ